MAQQCGTWYYPILFDFIKYQSIWYYLILSNMKVSDNIMILFYIISDTVREYHSKGWHNPLREQWARLSYPFCGTSVCVVICPSVCPLTQNFQVSVYIYSFNGNQDLQLRIKVKIYIAWMTVEAVHIKSSNFKYFFPFLQ